MGQHPLTDAGCEPTICFETHEIDSARFGLLNSWHG